ncbi:MAG: sodium/solute symporter [bacterium]
MKNFQRFFVVAALVCASVTGSQASTNSFEFQQRDLAFPSKQPGSFFGQSGTALIVGGGMGHDFKPNGKVFVQPAGEKQWREFELKTPVIMPGYVSATLTENGKSVNRLILVGGTSTNGITTQVQVLEWLDNTLHQTLLPSLPVALSGAGVGFFEDQSQKQLYVVGGQAEAGLSQRLFRLAFKGPSPKWEELPPIPGEGRMFPGVICFYNDVHVFGGINAAKMPIAQSFAYRWKVIDGSTMTGWRELAPLPLPLGAPLVFQTGQVHAGLAGGITKDAHSDAIWSYHNVTDTWVAKGVLPETLSSGAVLKINGKQMIVSPKGDGVVALDMTVRRTVKSLSAWDYVFLLGYFIVVAFAGIWYAHRQKSTASFALGDRKVPWWMAGISMFATGASSISFMAIPAQAFRTSWLWAFPWLMLIPLFFVEAYIIYPLIRKLSITSTYEYLERRFHPSLRYIASAQCIALQTFGRMNMVLLLPALAIAAVTGLDVVYSVLLMGVVTTIYTAKGGLKAVILTEMIQGITMIIGVSLMIVLAITGLRGGWGDFVEIGTRFHKFDTGIWTMDLTAPIFWLIILTPILNKLAFASDQPVVQRVFATPLKDVRKLAGMFLVCSVAIPFMVNLAGIGAFAYFHQHPMQLDLAMTNDQIIPLYIVQRLPIGFAGLIIAALFAAAASALAGSMNSVATIFTEDFYRKAKKNSTDHERLVVMRIASIVSGLVATLCAIYMAKMNMRSLFQTWNELFALLGGGFLGVFILGIFTHRTHAIGAFTGAIASIGVTIFVKQYTSLHWYGYMPAAVIACVVIGYVVSLVVPGRKKDLTGLTVFDIKRDISGEDHPNG